MLSVAIGFKVNKRAFELLLALAIVQLTFTNKTTIT